MRLLAEESGPWEADGRLFLTANVHLLPPPPPLLQVFPLLMSNSDLRSFQGGWGWGGGGGFSSWLADKKSRKT